MQRSQADVIPQVKVAAGRRWGAGRITDRINLRILIFLPELLANPFPTPAERAKCKAQFPQDRLRSGPGQ